MSIEGRRVSILIKRFYLSLSILETRSLWKLITTSHHISREIFFFLKVAGDECKAQSLERDCVVLANNRVTSKIARMDVASGFSSV